MAITENQPCGLSQEEWQSCLNYIAFLVDRHVSPRNREEVKAECVARLLADLPKYDPYRYNFVRNKQGVWKGRIMKLKSWAYRVILCDILDIRKAEARRRKRDRR